LVWLFIAIQKSEREERREEKKKKGRDNFFKYKIKREFFSVYFRVKYKTELENM